MVDIGGGENLNQNFYSYQGLDVLPV
jgi:hypothetical protein